MWMYGPVLWWKLVLQHVWQGLKQSYSVCVWVSHCVDLSVEQNCQFIFLLPFFHHTVLLEPCIKDLFLCTPAVILALCFMWTGQWPPLVAWMMYLTSFFPFNPGAVLPCWDSGPFLHVCRPVTSPCCLNCTLIKFLLMLEPCTPQRNSGCLFHVHWRTSCCQSV